MQLPILLGMLMVCICCYVCQSFFNKLYASAYEGGSEATLVFTAIYGAIVSILVWAVCAGFHFTPGWETWVFGAANAGFLFVYNLSSINACRTGPYSVQSVIRLFGGVLLPVLFSIIFWGDELTIGNWMGIALTLVAFLMINGKGLSLVNAKKGFYLWSGLLFVSNGLYGILMDAQQRVTMESQKNEMIIITFFISALISVVYLLFTRGMKAPKAFHMNRRAWCYALISSVCAAVAVYLMMQLLGNMDASIYYTVVNGAVLALSVLLSAVVLHDKLTRLMWAGIAVSVVGMALLVR